MKEPDIEVKARAAGDPSGAHHPYHRPKIGIALGSGIARGWAHIGVLRGLIEDGIVPDVVAGTSIGAVVGGAFAADRLDAIEDWARNVSRIGFFRMLDFKLRGGGMFGGNRFDELMRDKFGSHNIEDLVRPFTAIGTELSTGHEVWLRDGNLATAIRASFALPGVFEPVNCGGRWIVDGALVNPVPISVCRSLGAELVIAVNLSEDVYGPARAKREGLKGTGPFGVFTELSKAPSMGGRRTAGSLWKRIFRQESSAPSIFANLVASLNIAQTRLSRSRLAGDPPDVLIAPRCGHIGLMEFHRADELIDEGYEAYQRRRDYLRDALTMIGYS